MAFNVRYAGSARDDLRRLFGAAMAHDLESAGRAMEAIDRSMVMLEEFPFSCRKADPANPFLRELLIGFGRSGYVALFEIVGVSGVLILAVRHQRENDYH